MIRNYLLIALRNLRRRGAYSFINIAGLAIGMACAILIFLSIRYDLSFDRFHANADRTFRVLTIDRALGVTNQRVGITLPALGPAMKTELPEVVDAVRMNEAGRTLVTLGDKDLYAEDLFYAEPGVFDVFNFPLVEGDAATALQQPNTAVMTTSLARRLFGAQSPVGETITISHNTDLRVTGVAEDVPATSHLQFDLLVSMVPTETDSSLAQYLQSWNNISMTTYAVLDDPAHAAGMDAKLDRILRANDVSANFSVTLQPLTETHLGSSDILFDGANAGKSDVLYVYGLAAVGLFVLLIAMLNFMNLATARSADRAREVGVRKVMGAARRQLIGQHLGESAVLCGIAFLVALALAAVTLPFVGGVLGKALSLSMLWAPATLLFLAGMAAVVTLLSGSYPAFVLSAFQPVEVLKGSFKRGTHGARLRQALVVVQFTASVVMIIGSLIVVRQLGYVMHMNVGYDRDQVLLVDLNSPQLNEQGATLRAEAAALPGVAGTALASSAPGRQLGRAGLQPEGASPDDNWIMSIMTIDEHFLPLMGIEMAEGRNFSRDRGTDADDAILINEAAARALGWQDAVGRHLTLGQDREVVGVVRDFHYASARYQVEPLVMLYQPEGGSLLALKLEGGRIDEALQGVRKAWQQLNPGYPFEYNFLNDEFGQQYREETNFSWLARGFTVISIFIACLGLFGLAAFTAEQRTKEIGIRKVLGASVTQLVALLSRDFLVLVLAAIVLAAPLAYLAMNRWLEGFAYRIDLGVGTFLLAGSLAVTIALLAVSYQSVKAALANPVDSLRYE